MVEHGPLVGDAEGRPDLAVAGHGDEDDREVRGADVAEVGGDPEQPARVRLRWWWTEVGEWRRDRRGILLTAVRSACASNYFLYLVFVSMEPGLLWLQANWPAGLQSLGLRRTTDACREHREKGQGMCSGQSFVPSQANTKERAKRCWTFFTPRQDGARNGTTDIEHVELIIGKEN